MGPLGVLRQRPLPFGAARTGELLGWSRILVDEQALCVVNPNGRSALSTRTGLWRVVRT